MTSQSVDLANICSFQGKTTTGRYVTEMPFENYFDAAVLRGVFELNSSWDDDVLASEGKKSHGEASEDVQVDFDCRVVFRVVAVVEVKGSQEATQNRWVNGCSDPQKVEIAEFRQCSLANQGS